MATSRGKPRKTSGISKLRKSARNAASAGLTAASDATSMRTNPWPAGTMGALDARMPSRVLGKRVFTPERR